MNKLFRGVGDILAFIFIAALVVAGFMLIALGG